MLKGGDSNRFSNITGAKAPVAPVLNTPLCTASQIIGGDFAKFCSLLRIYELYKNLVNSRYFCIMQLNN